MQYDRERKLCIFTIMGVEHTATIQQFDLAISLYLRRNPGANPMRIPPDLLVELVLEAKNAG